MRLSFRPERIKRYRDFAALLLRHGRADLVRQTGLDRIIEVKETAHETSERARRLTDDLESMGATFVKLGQLLSTRADLLPQTYLDALERLQSAVAPVTFDEIAAIVEEDLERPVDEVFASFEREPLAAASLGQVHRARLADGREVAVKVQRPGMRDLIEGDLEMLGDVAAFMDAYTDLGRVYDFSRIVDGFRDSITAELDYRREAANLHRFRTILSGYQHIVIPEPIDELCSQRVVTMELVHGRPTSTLAEGATEANNAIDGPLLAKELFRAYLDQVLVHGMFHADPHPGNVLVTDDGKLALLDFGMIGRVREGLRLRLLELLIAIGDGKGDHVARIALDIGDTRDDSLNVEHFKSSISDLVAREHTSNLDQLDVGNLVLEICRICGRSGVVVPQSLTLLGKALLNLDQIARRLDPQFDPPAEIRKRASRLMAKQLARSASPSAILQGLLQSKELVQELPGRANKILELLANNRLKVGIDVMDEKNFIVGLQRIANRIATAVLLGSLVVGAALTLRIDAEPKLLGYPAIALVLFTAAAIAGGTLVVRILWNDFRDR